MGQAATFLATCLLGINWVFQVQSGVVQFKDCGSTKAKIVELTVDPCNDPAICKLVKGTTPQINVTFVPDGKVTSVKAKVQGILPLGIKVPFQLDNDDGCKESGLACPLTTGKKYTYTKNIEIKAMYPNIKVLVHWELQDEAGEDLVCFVLATKIS